MKINKLKNNNGTTAKACDLVSRYVVHEQQGGTLATFLQGFDFESREEIADTIRKLIYGVTLDPYMSRKDLGISDPFCALLYKRMSKIACDANRFDKYPTTLSGEIWHGGYCRKRLEDRTAAMFDKVVPSEDLFVKAKEKIMKIYSLSEQDLEKLHFFVEQVKAGANFPNSLRRMLYIWGTAKMTGKTTCATMIVSLLNGDNDETNIARYSTSLAVEMQIRSFAVPKVSECNVCLMDECFYNDMGKTYADFKRYLTSSNGRARLPFGQEFEWVGQPNYVATSNDSLQKFIKDWNDRRYLSVEFKQKPTTELSFKDIKALWWQFISNSQRTKDWKEWADEIATYSNEEGEKSVRSFEFEVELRKKEMIDFIYNLTSPSDSPACPQTHITLKVFVDYFARDIGANEANKRRPEIESAVIAVFGERYSTTNYWLLPRLKEVCHIMRRQIDYADYPEMIDDNKEEEQQEELPF